MTEALASYLELYAVKPNDSGKYICKVSNVAGSVTSVANLFVKEPTHLVKKGGYAELTCKVTGTPEIKITWFKDDRELKESDKFRMSFAKSLAVLHLTDVETEDSGEYICEARNDPQSQEVVPHARVQFKALVKGSTPLQIKWFKDSQELLSGANRSVWMDDTSSVLELFSARMSDSGNYTCQISNDVGTATCKATLFVKGVQPKPPRFIQMPTPVVALREGQSTTFECHIVGTPEIHVTWYLDGNEMTDEAKYGISFIDDESGDYICEAQNPAGKASCSTKVTVKGYSVVYLFYKGAQSSESSPAFHDVPRKLSEVLALLLVVPAVLMWKNLYK
uniref:Ig-like domain-containing protein n=1 Tax=Phasianus colchicus TaxID=9054 RepID=A0A669QB79_PHACC